MIDLEFFIVGVGLVIVVLIFDYLLHKTKVKTMTPEELIKTAVIEKSLEKQPDLMLAIAEEHGDNAVRDYKKGAFSKLDQLINHHVKQATK